MVSNATALKGPSASRGLMKIMSRSLSFRITSASTSVPSSRMSVVSLNSDLMSARVVRRITMVGSSAAADATVSPEGSMMVPLASIFRSWSRLWPRMENLMPMTTRTVTSAPFDCSATDRAVSRISAACAKPARSNPMTGCKQYFSRPASWIMAPLHPTERRRCPGSSWVATPEKAYRCPA